MVVVLEVGGRSLRNFFKVVVTMVDQRKKLLISDDPDMVLEILQI